MKNLFDWLLHLPTLLKSVPDKRPLSNSLLLLDWRQSFEAVARIESKLPRQLTSCTIGYKQAIIKQ
ncbi:MAG: hypothetical protein R2822_10565 [Spirosomataceae bacterium]